MSSLVAHAIAEIVGDHLGRPVRIDGSGDDDLLAEAAPPALGEVVGDVHGVRTVVCIDQKPIGRTPRANVATDTGVFDRIRWRFAETSLDDR